MAKACLQWMSWSLVSRLLVPSKHSEDKRSMSSVTHNIQENSNPQVGSSYRLCNSNSLNKMETWKLSLHIVLLDGEFFYLLINLFVVLILMTFCTLKSI